MDTSGTQKHPCETRAPKNLLKQQLASGFDRAQIFFQLRSSLSRNPFWVNGGKQTGVGASCPRLLSIFPASLAHFTGCSITLSRPPRVEVSSQPKPAERKIGDVLHRSSRCLQSTCRRRATRSYPFAPSQLVEAWAAALALPTCAAWAMAVTLRNCRTAWPVWFHARPHQGSFVVSGHPTEARRSSL